MSISMHRPATSRAGSPIAALLAGLLLTGCSEPAPPPPTAAAPDTAAPAPAAEPAPRPIDAARIRNADAEPGNWLTHGRTYSEQRYSPLDQIHAGNAGQLGLAWYFDLDTRRGQEATPIVVDGVMYVSTAWSKVKALDAATGELRWAFDPKVPGEIAVYACCDVVNRGVAVWDDKVYVGALDGRLIALEAADGSVAWEVQTVDRSQPYTITGAPRIVNGLVIIGNGGAEIGVRGYVSAYDAQTGALVWRFYTVPGDPAQPFEAPILAEAARTWTGQWWQYGGGGTVWDSMAYDPELDLLYIGVGNGSPWNHRLRSPGGGDNLFLSSIVALRPATGEYVWHYQTTPGETWDYTATMHMILADLTIDGRPRKVIMQAPKNGFFYVLDRSNGEFISAEKFAAVNWATGIDPATGRPIENPAARYDVGKPFVTQPGPGGAHSWQPMAFNPNTGLVYLPVQEMGFPYAASATLEIRPRGFNTGTDFDAASMPQDPAIKGPALAGATGHLAAWDPVAQREVWRVQYPGPSNGGVLTTAGNLVVQGTAGGEFAVYRADTGAKLYGHDVQSGVLAAPVSYTVNGEQYLAVAVGWGGVMALSPGEISHKSQPGSRNISRVVAFKLGGGASLPPAPPLPPLNMTPPAQTADAATVAEGKRLYHGYCGTCHGDTAVSGGILPDLRWSALLGNDGWFNVVLDGALAGNGMVSFAPVLDRAGADAVRAYVVARAHESLAEQAAR